jgi:hypothetical protein
MAQRQIGCHTVKRAQFQASAERPNTSTNRSETRTPALAITIVLPFRRLHLTFNLRCLHLLKLMCPLISRPKGLDAIQTNVLYSMSRESCANQSYEGVSSGSFYRCLTVYTMYLPHVNSRVCVPQALFILYSVTLPHLDRTLTNFVKE